MDGDALAGNEATRLRLARAGVPTLVLERGRMVGMLTFHELLRAIAHCGGYVAAAFDTGNVVGAATIAPVGWYVSSLRTSAER